MSKTLIKDVNIIDGNRLSKIYKADVIIEDDYIKDINFIIDKNCCDKIIYADNLYLTPGFIDVHSHSDYMYFIDNKLFSKIFQGITTEINGNCGASPGPLYGQMFEDEKNLVKREYGKDLIKWQNLGSYLDIVEKLKPILNVAQLVGHAMIRGSVLGLSKKKADLFSKKQMARLLEISLSEGAIGMSLGLQYAPDSYSNIDELVFLSKILYKNSKILTAHIRNEGEFVFDALFEFFEIIKRSKVKGQVSHIKTAYPNNKKSNLIIDLLYKFRNNGFQILADHYPYTAFYTALSVILPEFIHSVHFDKFKKNIILYKDDIKNYFSFKLDIFKNIYPAKLNSKIYKDFISKNIFNIANILNKDVIDTYLDIFLKEDNDIPAIFFFIDESDVFNFFKDKFIMVSTDSEGVNIKSDVLNAVRHPRAFNTYVKILKEFILTKKLLTLNEAVFKMTKLPALWFNIKKRGEIKKGYFADIVIWNFDKLSYDDNYFSRRQYPIGIEYMFINGKIVIEKGRYTGIEAGRVLRW